MVNDALDFGVILEECRVDSEASTLVAAKLIARISDFNNESDVVDFLEYILSNVDDPEILYSVIKFSDSHRDPRVLSKLLDLLLFKEVENVEIDDFINVRVIATKAISNYKDTSTLGTLLYCLNNKQENYKVRLACADALGRIGDRYAVSSLIDVVQDEEEKSIYVKESATFALGLLGDTSAIDPLVSIMEAKQGLLGKFSFLKEKIVEALGKLNLNNKRVLKVLKNALYDSSPMVRINAIEALMNSEYDEAYELIQKIGLKDEDEEVQRNALIALYNMSGKDILEEVLSLPSYSEFLKQQAQDILEEYEV